MSSFEKQAFIYWFRFVVGKILNAMIFYVVWVLCIAFAARGEPIWGVAISWVLLFFHFLMTQYFRKDLILLLSLMSLGFLIDTIYIQMGLIEYLSPTLTKEVAPLWIVTIWGVFALSLNHSMWWMKGRYLLSAFLGAWGGIASYVAGERLGAAVFLRDYTLTLFIIGIVWFCALPLCIRYAVWIDTFFDEVEDRKKE